MPLITILVLRSFLEVVTKRLVLLSGWTGSFLYTIFVIWRFGYVTEKGILLFSVPLHSFCWVMLETGSFALLSTDLCTPIQRNHLFLLFLRFFSLSLLPLIQVCHSIGHEMTICLSYFLFRASSYQSLSFLKSSLSLLFEPRLACSARALA